MVTTNDKSEKPEEPPPKKDPSHKPRRWDPFDDGLPRGVPGEDADFDIDVNRPPWEKG